MPEELSTMTVGARLSNPAFPRRFPPAPPVASRPVARPAAARMTPPRRRSRYDRWIGPVAIMTVLIFCTVMGLAGWTLVQHALQR